MATNNGIMFSDILYQYFDEIAAKHGWGASTQKQYQSTYIHKIIPIMNERPLSEYSAEDLEQAYTAIACSGRPLSKFTLRRYHALIRVVVECAVEKGLIADPMWDVIFPHPTAPTEIAKREKKIGRLPKSMTPIMQVRLGEALYENALNSGDVMDLMLMYEAGLRPKEAAGTSIGDYNVPNPDVSYSTVDIYNSTIGQSHERHNALKTTNGYRMAILGPRATEILNEQIAKTTKLLDDGTLRLDPNNGVPTIKQVPIGLNRKDAVTPCASPQLTKAFRKLREEIQYEREDFETAQRIAESDEFEQATKQIVDPQLGFAEEKDATAYILRRQLNTDAHIVGYIAEERQYAMGHRIENTAVDRRDFRNLDILNALAAKQCKRPSVNRSVLEQQVVEVQEGSYQNDDVHDIKLQVPIKKGRLNIRITSHEPLTPAQVTMMIPEGVTATCRYYQKKSNLPQRQAVNVLNDYYEAFRKAYALLDEEKRLRDELEKEGQSK